MVHVVAVEKLAPPLVIPSQSSCLLVKADAARNSVELRTSSAVSVEVASSQQPIGE
jgi:hypothetical protein